MTLSERDFFNVLKAILTRLWQGSISRGSKSLTLIVHVLLIAQDRTLVYILFPRLYDIHVEKEVAPAMTLLPAGCVHHLRYIHEIFISNGCYILPSSSVYARPYCVKGSEGKIGGKYIRPGREKHYSFM